MPATDSFVSSALAVSSTTATLMSTESFTSSAVAVSSTLATLSDNADGTKLNVVAPSQTITIRVKNHGASPGVYLVNSSGDPLVFPLSLDDARALAPALLGQVT